MSLGNWKEATEYFSKIQKKEPHYAEAAFYASLGYTKLGDYGRALATVVPLSSDLPLIGVYNNAGAVAVQAARENKNEAERTRLLAQGTEFLLRPRRRRLRTRWSISTTAMRCFWQESIPRPPSIFVR